MKGKQAVGRMEGYLITADFFPPQVSVLPLQTTSVNTDWEVFNLEW